jgi:hypothetical protein
MIRRSNCTDIRRSVVNNLVAVALTLQNEKENTTFISFN